MQRHENDNSRKVGVGYIRHFLMAIFTGTICLFQSCFASELIAQSQNSASAFSNQELFRFELSVRAMGSDVDFVVYSPSELEAKRVIDAGLAEIERLSAVLSNYDSNSEISKLCGAPKGVWTPVSHDLASVLMHSRRWNKLSEGKFDITIGPLTQLWRTSRKSKALPNPSELSAAKQRCGWNFVGMGAASNGTLLDQPNYVNVVLFKPNMILDLSGLAVGYIVDLAFEKMLSLGSRSILLNAGGDIRVGDAPPGSEGWRITIAGLGKESPPLASLRIHNCAVTTSGDLNQYVEIDGRRYSHFIDPETGAPIERRQSVTVLAATTLDADAGATALAVLGMNRAAELFDDLPLLEGIFMEADPTDMAPIRARWLNKD